MCLISDRERKKKTLEISPAAISELRHPTESCDSTLPSFHQPTIHLPTHLTMSLSAYIVKFKKPTSDDAVTSLSSQISSLTESIKEKGGSIKHVYGSRTFHGFAGSFDETTRKELEGTDGVEFIEPDGEVSVQ